MQKCTACHIPEGIENYDNEPLAPALQGNIITDPVLELKESGRFVARPANNPCRARYYPDVFVAAARIPTPDQALLLAAVNLFLHCHGAYTDIDGQ